MKLTGLHLLLTYKCNFECDHCFVWGSPRQKGTMRPEDVEEILRQAQDMGTVEWIYYEGGEPFLTYSLLVQAVRAAAGMGFKVGIVSNSYWASSLERAMKKLAPLAGLVQDMALSDDIYHGNQRVNVARAAAGASGIPVSTITVSQPEAANAAAALGQLPPGESRVMYRGRAALELASRAEPVPWENFTECPYENLRDPGRVHVDPFGYLHMCQGIIFGNLFQTPLKELCASFDAESHPIVGALLAGGPAELARRYGITPPRACADACQLCYETRLALRERFPEQLAPDNMYGVPG